MLQINEQLQALITIQNVVSGLGELLEPFCIGGTGTSSPELWNVTFILDPTPLQGNLCLEFSSLATI